MSIRNKLFLSFFALIALNLFVFKFVFEDIIVVQLKTDRHNQYRYEKETAEKVRVNQLLSASNFKDPTDRSELEKQLPEDLVYKMLVKDANGNTIFIKTSQAYNLKNPPRKIKKENTDLKVVAEYHFQHEPPKKGETIIYFYTDDSDIMAKKGSA
jgi:uncharacterized protein YpmS